MFFILVYHFSFSFCFFFFNDTATTEIYTLSLHDALPIYQACADMAQFVEAGVTTFDCADIYTGVEALIGSFLRAYPSLAKQVQVHTKFVPDLSVLKTVDRPYVESIIDRSLTRLGVECLDLVQFHWWDFAVARYVETAFELDRLR